MKLFYKLLGIATMMSIPTMGFSIANPCNNIGIGPGLKNTGGQCVWYTAKTQQAVGQHGSPCVPDILETGIC